MSIKWTDHTAATGDEFEVPRRRGEDDGLGVSLLKGIAMFVVLVPWYALRHPLITGTLAVSVSANVQFGPVAVLAGYMAAAVALVGWRLTHQASFTRWVRYPARSRWRSIWVYRRRWRTTMHWCGLSKSWGTTRYAPHVVKVKSDAFTDRVRVGSLLGQAPSDFEKRCEALAWAFGASDCHIDTTGARRLWLVFTYRDRLTTTVPALPVPASVDLAAVPVGVTDIGQPWTLPVLGTHVLVAGATGSGKGSIIWSVIRALMPAIREGWAQVWAIDPKGGMELAPGSPLFARFAFDPEPMVQLIEQAAELVHARGARYRGNTRLHQPTTAEPFTLLIIDELAFLTAYLPDKALSKRLTAALSVVLSQGRAVGVSVLAAVQDPRKEIVNLRDLLPTRVALRLTEPGQVDMILGSGARERGAHCDQIPRATPGVGYVLLEGHREPVRVRAAHVTDDDIAAMTRTPTVTHTADQATGHAVSVIRGEVVA